MTLAAMFDTPATLYRVSEGGPDEYNDAELVSDVGSPVVCAIQPATRAAGDEGPELALEQTRWTVFLPADVGAFGGGDYLVTSTGDRYDFEADPWIDTRPRVGHVEASARRVR